ncbi:MAG: hypothetical protein KUG78_02225 [Kangiellaceae bacterium]|nr:hypothetical protein [Kangiellaceae bacterium]
MNKELVKEKLESLNDEDTVEFLLRYGHELTIHARSGYEFQGSGVDDARLLRDCNEILHRVFQAIREIINNSEKRFSLGGISHWIVAEERNETIQQASMQAFNRAMKKCNT